jgi:hypothetical protein
MSNFLPGRKSVCPCGDLRSIWPLEGICHGGIARGPRDLIDVVDDARGQQTPLRSRRLSRSFLNYRLRRRCEEWLRWRRMSRGSMLQLRRRVREERHVGRGRVGNRVHAGRCLRPHAKVLTSVVKGRRSIEWRSGHLSTGYSSVFCGLIVIMSDLM